MRLNEREIHGATPMAGSAKEPLAVCEGDDKIVLREGYSIRLTLTPESARHLARKLNRLALRIEKRSAIAMEAAAAGETEGLDPKDDSAGPKDIAPSDRPST